MSSDSQDGGVITDEKAELIRDRKENFQKLADEAQSTNRFQLIVAGFGASLLAILENNELVAIDQLLSQSSLAIFAVALFSIAVSMSHITFHIAKKMTSQQSELLFDDVIYDRYASDEELEKRFGKDAMNESILRWMVSISGAITIVTIFFLIFGIFELYFDIGSLIYLVLLLLLFGGILVYMFAIMGTMAEAAVGDIRTYWRKEQLSKRIKRRIKSLFRRGFSRLRSEISSLFQ